MSSVTTHTKNDFSTLYYLLRKAEGRVYTDDEVALLPEINERHKHYKEWIARNASCDKLVWYLSHKKKNLQILEVGCGNGWLAAKLTTVPGSTVTGIDINAEELGQAKRVFSKKWNLTFFNCSLDDNMIEGTQYDIIVFAASVQYFSSLTKVLGDALKMLKPGGEIHLIDTNFYSQKELAAARQRTMEYYRSVGVPQMTDRYFHHSKEELAQFEHEVLYDPHSLINRIKTNKNPFYWIKINA